MLSLSREVSDNDNDSDEDVEQDAKRRRRVIDIVEAIDNIVEEPAVEDGQTFEIIPFTFQSGEDVFFDNGNRNNILRSGCFEEYILAQKASSNGLSSLGLVVTGSRPSRGGAGNAAHCPNPDWANSIVMIRAKFVSTHSHSPLTNSHSHSHAPTECERSR